MRQLCDGLPKVAEITTCTEVRVAIELLMDTGRRPEEACDLPWDCLERDKDGKYVLVYDNLKCQRRRRELPITDATARLITGQQQRVRGRYPRTPVAELKLLPAPKMNPRGTKPLRTATLNENHRAWADALPPLMTRHGSTLTEFDKASVFPYAYRHTYAQRHANAGVPVDVLRELLDHDSMDTTRIYYRIGAERQREAVDRLTRHQLDRHGNHVWHQAQALLDAARTRQVIGQVAVPYGICTEPSNVQRRRRCRSGSAARAATTSAPTCPTCPTSRHTCTTCSATANGCSPPPSSTTGHAPRRCPPRKRSAAYARS